MERNCDECGTVYVAKRKTSRFCSDRCRQRAKRKPPPAPVVTIAPAPEATEKAKRRGRIEAATYAELVAVGQDETALGEVALMLAERLDNPMVDTGSAIASLVREHKKTLAEAIAAGTAEADPLDELQKRRQERRARA